MVIQHRHKRGGQAIVFLLIVVALIGAGAWWLVTAKAETEQEARAFAAEVGKRLAFDYDGKYLSLHLAPKAQVAYPPSFRDRLIENLRRQGKPTQPVAVTGKVEFTSYFFEAKGSFRVEIDYASAPAYLDLVVSHPKALWQIDGMNFTWTAAPD